jgi:uncharacterized protein YutE (UPF0331/DUF86 family)
VTDPDLVAKKLAQIETYIAELRRLANPDALGHEDREERFVEHTLQLAIQAATSLRNMAGFRNILVHGYDRVDIAIVRDVLIHRLDDLLGFAAAMRTVLQSGR